MNRTVRNRLIFLDRVSLGPTIDTRPESMKSISSDSWPNQRKLISQILFSV